MQARVGNEYSFGLTGSKPAEAAGNPRGGGSELQVFRPRNDFCLQPGRSPVSTGASPMKMSRRSALLFPAAAGLVAAVLPGCAGPSGGAQMGYSCEPFGRLRDGRAVQLHTLTGPGGMRVRIMDLGATITEVSVPDRDGRLANVVIGADNLETYLKGFPGSAAVIGRYANRIRKGRFPLDGREVQVTVNNGENHLHGGREGFGSKLWAVDGSGSSRDKAWVRFSLRSADGEEGFPGNIGVKVTYTLTRSGELRLDYEAVTDAPTVVNLTNHAYFNLAGSGSVHDQELQIFADQYTPTDKGLIPTGELAPVAGTGLDFREPHAIGERIGQYPGTGGYDHNFVLRGWNGTLRPAVRAFHRASGRVMECLTTEPGVQLYTGNHFGGRPGDPASWGRHPAFCLETQHMPDSPNKPQFPSTVLRPGRTFRSTTVYRFSIAR